MEKLDVFIPATKKDFITLEFSITSLIQHIPEINNIIVSMPDICQNKREYNIDGHKVNFFNDFEILRCDSLSLCKFRPNWIYQQLLKILQDKTKTDNVLIFDADLIVLSKFDVFRDNKPMLYFKMSPTMTYTDDWQMFENFISKFSNGDLHWKDSTKTHKSFIADLSIFNINIIDEMLQRYGHTRDSFARFTLQNTEYFGNHCGTMISEYQLYGMYCQKYHSDEFVIDQLKVTEFNKYQMSQNQQSYTRDEIVSAMKDINPHEFNVVKFQTGCCASDIHYNLCMGDTEK